LLDNQNVIRWLAQQTRANAIAQALHRVTHQASRSNCRVNKVVETLSLSRVRQTFLSIHDQTAAAPALKPLSANQILIGFAYGIVVNFKPSGEFTHTRQLLPCLETVCHDQKHDLFRQLVPYRYVAFAVDLDIHQLPYKGEGTTRSTRGPRKGPVFSTLLC